MYFNKCITVATVIITSKMGISSVLSELKQYIKTQVSSLSQNLV